MVLRVLDADRAGYAILLFDQAPASSELSIAIRSLSVQAGLFLGPEGKWQRAPHYFSAERSAADASGRSFGVGPEIVNHMREQDRFDVVGSDGRVIAETTWENAVPQMPSRSGPGHTIYQPPRPTRPEPMEARKPPPAPSPAPQQTQPTTTAPIEPLTLAPVDKPPGGGTGTPPVRPVQPIPVRRSWWPLLAGLLLIALGGTALAVAFVPGLRCGVLGLDCRQEELLASVLTCARQKQATTPCAVDGCFVAYRAEGGVANTDAEVARIRTDAAEACRRRDAEAADIARNCAKSFGAARACEVRSKCMVSYFSNFPEGAERGELERVASEADSTCNLVEQERQKAATARACIESRMTSRDPCAIEAQCIAPYLAAFPEGASNLELKGAAQRAREACALRASEAEARRREEESARQREEERQAAEEAERRREEERRAVEEAERRRVEEARVRREADLLAEARRCAASAEACVVEACYRQYLNEHGASTQASVARAAVEAARQLCQQRSGPTFVEGTYSGMVTAGCNAQQQRVHVTLRGGRISWRHEVQVPPSTAAVPFQWDGTIGSDGRIEAKVGNSTDYEAKGSYRDGYGDVRMYYRGCTTGPLSLRFSGSPLPAR